MRPAKTDQTGCLDWSASSLGAQVILLVLSCCGSNVFSKNHKENDTAVLEADAVLTGKMSQLVIKITQFRFFEEMQS